MTELWDAYDNKFNRIKDMTLVRGEPIPDGVYHLVCDIIVKHTDGSYLLMQRDLRKLYGGKWELTAGGSALQGEDPLNCDKQTIVLQEGETIGYQWVDRNTLFTMGSRKLVSDQTMKIVRELNL